MGVVTIQTRCRESAYGDSVSTAACILEDLRIVAKDVDIHDVLRIVDMAFDFSGEGSNCSTLLRP